MNKNCCKSLNEFGQETKLKKTNGSSKFHGSHIGRDHNGHVTDDKGDGGVLVTMTMC